MKLTFHSKPILFIFLTFGLYFYTLFPKILQIRPDGIYAGHVNVWSDWSLHIGMAQIFATKQPADWFAYHPMYAEGKFTYGFLTNLISGLLMRFGVPLHSAFIYPSIIYISFLLLGLYTLFFTLFKSRRIAVLAISLFFLSSGLLGFQRHLQHLSQDFSWQALFHPLENYTQIPEIQWYAGNVIVGLLVPQRAFLLGFTVAIWALNFFLLAHHKNRQHFFIFAGLLAGLLPIIHMHSLFALIILTGPVVIFGVIRSPKKLIQFLLYILPAGFISAILYFTFIAGGIANPQFMKIDLGWSAGSPGQWLTMWFAIWGLTLPVSLFGLYLYQKKNPSRINSLLLFGFINIFILANIIVFQPVYWDNSKLFFWSYTGLSGLSAFLIHQLWQKNILTKVIAILIFFLLTATGFTELLNLYHVEDHSYQMISNQEIDLANQIRHQTSVTDIFLTDTSHNHWVMMWAARPILLGYTPWAWNFGFNYQQAEQDLKDIYSFTSTAPELIRNHHIRYLVIGPSEIRNFHPNLSLFINRYPLAFSADSILVFDVSTEW